MEVFMYFINNPEKCVESIIKTADKNSLLKLLLKEAAKKYSAGKLIDPLLEAEIEFFKTRMPQASIYDIVLRAFFSLHDEDKQKILLSLVKDEKEKLIYRDTQLVMNNVSIYIKFRYEHNKIWSNSFMEIEEVPLSIFQDENTVFVETVSEESSYNEENDDEDKRKIVISRKKTNLLKKVEIHLENSKRKIDGLFLFSFDDVFICQYYRLKKSNQKKSWRKNTLQKDSIIIPFPFKTYVIVIGKSFNVSYILSREHADLYVESILTEKELAEYVKRVELFEKTNQKRVLTLTEFLKTSAEKACLF